MMAKIKINNLTLRFATGLLFVAIIVASILVHPLAFLIVFCLITGLTLWEFYSLMMTRGNSYLEGTIGVICGMYLFIASFIYSHWMAGPAIFLPYLLFLMFIMISQLYYRAPDPVSNWAVSFLGQVWIAGSFSLLNLILIPQLVLAVFVFIWINDTAAYVFGTALGKHKLFLRISPKKSWEGCISGLIFVVIAACVFFFFIREISLLNWLGLAVTVFIFGTWGDLVESLFKRTLDVKDSGNILPGHGGMLDRFDSFLMAVPAAYIYIRLFIF